MWCTSFEHYLVGLQFHKLNNIVDVPNTNACNLLLIAMFLYYFAINHIIMSVLLFSKGGCKLRCQVCSLGMIAINCYRRIILCQILVKLIRYHYRLSDSQDFVVNVFYFLLEPSVSTQGSWETDDVKKINGE